MWSTSSSSLPREVREIMAQLGMRNFDELIGRADLLDMKKGIEHWKARGLDFARIFYQADVPAEVARVHVETQDHGLAKALDPRPDREVEGRARERRSTSRSSSRCAT